MANLRLKKHIIEILDNQIKENDPLCTKAAFLQLQEQGYSGKEAKEMIAAVLLEEMYDVLTYEKAFDEQKYESKLKELVNNGEKVHKKNRRYLRTFSTTPAGTIKSTC